MKFTPGWAVGYFFVPIINLWKPYYAMEELWRGSQYQQDNAISQSNEYIENVPKSSDKSIVSLWCFFGLFII